MTWWIFALGTVIPFLVLLWALTGALVAIRRHRTKGHQVSTEDPEHLRLRTVVKRIRSYLDDDLGDKWEWPKWPDPEEPEENPEDYACRVTDRCQELICDALGGCEPMQDMCMRPEHDFCPHCRRLVPGGATRASNQKQGVDGDCG